MESLLGDALIQAGAIAVFVGMIVEGIKKGFLPNEQLEKLLPLIAMGVGIVLGVAYSVVTGDDLVLYVASGLIGGGFASGVYDAIHTFNK